LQPLLVDQPNSTISGHAILALLAVHVWFHLLFLLALMCSITVQSSRDVERFDAVDLEILL